ncbi:FAD:protein FMN transferase [Sulfurivermis fontis]|uniref:FAD:protein FMN transferase n=1 Tax=Sulfurivermis fontis TaxID=1972068 RepID=UPI000FD6DC8B|nr:FAD:protein FMN transferase [Sulfurivermis fontis]
MKWLMVILLAFALVACGGPQVQTLSGYAQGTTWHVAIWSTKPVDVVDLQAQINTEFDRLDRVLSNYRPDSVIERFNRSATTAPADVDTEIVTLVRIANGVSQASGGCYDLTVRPLFDLWGFDRDTLTPPTPAALAQVQAHVGFDKLTLPSATRLQKSDPEVRVDLSSIAQGYSVGRIAEVVAAAGIENYLVEIGGELQTRGRKPDGSHWRIGIERPLPGGRSVQKALTIRRESPTAVMTSGTYRHYFDLQGKRYSHILDARSGAPVMHDTVSVTVINDNATLADAWSTALLCMGRDAGVHVAQQHGIAALFISDADGTLYETATPAWRAMKDIEVN